MLTSLRTDIAETLEGLARNLLPPPTREEFDRACALLDGAATLRWVAAGDEEGLGDSDVLEAVDKLDEIRDLLEDVADKRLTPFAFRKAVAEVLGQ